MFLCTNLGTVIGENFDEREDSIMAAQKFIIVTVIKGISVEGGHIRESYILISLRHKEYKFVFILPSCNVKLLLHVFVHLFDR